MAKFCESCGHPLDDKATFCDLCGKKVQGTFCIKCGAALSAGEAFCGKCGTRAEAPRQPDARPQPPVQPMPQVRSAQPAAPAPRPAPPPAPPRAQPAVQPQKPASPYAAPAAPKKKGGAGLAVGLSLGAVALVALLIVGGVLIANAVGNAKSQLTPFPQEWKLVDRAPVVSCTYSAPDVIVPANYRSLDNIVFMQCSADKGSTNVLVSVEIPEFTQKYEQKIVVTRAETELIIHPPLLENAAQRLNTSKDAQINITARNADTGEIIIQDTRPLKLYSRNDIQWVGEDGTPYDENILAWVTPEATEIDTMLRDTADSLNYLTNGAVNAIVGYQQIGDWSAADISYAQVASMMYTLAYYYDVKYIMAPFSSTSADLQSVKTPAQVIADRGGLCVETAVTMASAVQRTNMHAVVILLPGHAQVAVETWYNSGEYLLVETTALDAARAGQWDGVITYMTKDQWRDYMAQEGYVAIDCDLAEQLHIQAID